MTKEKEYEYGAGITYICEHMTINHEAWVALDQLYELEDAEEFLLIQADDFIKDFYGFVPSEFAVVDIEILWSFWPDELDVKEEGEDESDDEE